MADSPYEDFFRAAKSSAVHLEMRDGYEKTERFHVWKAGNQPSYEKGYGQAWFDLMVESVGRGVEVRRARIVSEPISEYIRYEYEITAGHNVKAGEQVRWLPRRQATDLALPGNDFWLFDSEVVLVNHFNGDDIATGTEVIKDPAVVKLCATVFGAVWERAIPHEEYSPA